MERVAAEDPPYAQPASLERAVTLDRLICVVRARRRKATLREHQMRQRELVTADDGHGHPTRPTGRAHVIRVTEPVNSARRTAKGAAYAARFARTMTSTAGSCDNTPRRRISRRRRRKRLRATAVDWKRGTMIPVRGWPD